MPKVAINGVGLNYEDSGAGEPLLLLMGFGDGIAAWSAQIPAFAARHRTIALDHRGTGDSDSPEDGYTIEQFADDAIGLLDHLGVARAHVLGYSMGGRVAQDMAARHASRVGAIVLAASAAKANPLNVYSLRAGAYLYRRFGPEAAAAFGPLISFTHRYFEDHLGTLSDGLGAPSAHPMALHAYEGHVRAIEQHDSTPMLERITAPALILMGDQEWLNPAADAEIMLAGIADSRLHVLEGGGHGLLWEIPDSFNRAVLAFLAANPL